MQQHPIPQNVLSMEFQLVGSLTIRQFAYLGIGGVLVFALFVLPIPDWIKWPLMLTVAAFAGSLAYIPINDIPFDRWIVAFFRAINSPTKRIWHKSPKKIEVLAADYTRRFLRSAENPPPASDRTKLDEYLATLRSNQPKSELDRAEESYIQSLPFEEGGPPPAPRPALLAPQVMAEPIEQRVIEEDLTKPAPLQPTVKPIITVHMPHKNIYVKKVSTTTVNRQLHSLASIEGTIVMPVRGEKTFELSEDLRKRIPTAESASSGLTGFESTPVIPAPPLPVEINQPVPTAPAPPSYDRAGLEAELAIEADQARADLIKRASVYQKPPAPTQPASHPVKPAPQPVQPAPILEEAPLPQFTTPQPTGKLEPVKPRKLPSGTVAPTPAVGRMAPQPSNIANVVVGLVRDHNGLLLTDVVVVVKDKDGEPVRALKSNKVGQFAISTPLPSGDYTISLGKDGYNFDTIAVTLDGQIFQPIEIRSK